MEATQFLTEQHRAVEALFRQYEESTAAGRTRQLFDKTEIAIITHAAIEEMHVYPLIRDKVPNGAELADHAIGEHTIVEETLKELEALEPGSPEFDDSMRILMAAIRSHVQEEETNPGLFPLLRDALSIEQLEGLGKKLEKAAKTTPTRAHPRAPNTPPANKIAGMGAAVVDRARDLVSGRGKTY